MTRQRALAALALILVLILPLSVAAEAPPAPTTRQQQRVDSLPMAGLAEMVTFVNDFAPGAATPSHTHPGLTMVSVLEGELTFRSPAGERPYQAGGGFAEGPNEVVTAHNASAGKTRVMVSVVVPKGAAPSTPQPGGPSPAPATPTTMHMVRADAFFPGDPYEVAQVVLDFAPGAQTPPRSHPGQAFVTVLAGEVTLTSQGAAKTYKAGESFIEQPGVVGQARNAGAAPATLLTTHLLPKGAALTTPAATPATGGGGMARRAPSPAVLVLVVGLILASGWLLYRRLGRA